jgi:hypothetical protein
MHPMGIALAFLVFWSLVAAGVFLVRLAGTRLRRLPLRRAGGEAIHVDASFGVALALHVLTVALGVALIAAGTYATYVVLVAP